jgi:hypothetical protein
MCMELRLLLRAEDEARLLVNKVNIPDLLKIITLGERKMACDILPVSRQPRAR